MTDVCPTAALPRTWLRSVRGAVDDGRGIPAGGFGGQAQLKNKTVIEGEIVRIKGLTPSQIARMKGPTESFPIVMIHAGFKRYFVPRMQMDWPRSDLTPQPAVPDFFEFHRKLTHRKALPVSMQGVRALKPWSRFGRRTVDVTTSRGHIQVVQGVMKINPKYVVVEGITHFWKHGLAVTSIPAGELAAMIRTTIDPKKPPTACRSCGSTFSRASISGHPANWKSWSRTSPNTRRKATTSASN